MNKIVILDSNSLLNRAFYAIPSSFTDVEGRPTNAVYGFTTMLIKIINEINPTHLIATFDMKKPTFRHEKCSYYKATRKGMPDELATQLPLIKQLLTAMSIKIVEKEGYEADDILGTLSHHLDGEKIIVTGDKDSLQLVSESTKVWITKKGVSEVIEYDLMRLQQDGLTPRQVIELKSLMGDASDNIKGAAGIGEKTAKDLIANYISVENVYKHLDELKPAIARKLEASRDLVIESEFLATIFNDVPIEVGIDDCKFSYPFNEEVYKLFEIFSFKSLLQRVQFKNVVKKDIIKTENKKINTTQEIEDLKGKLAVVFAEDIHIANSSYIDYTIPIKRSFLDEGFEFDEIAKLLFNKKELILFDMKSVMYNISEYINVYKLDAFDVQIAAYLTNSSRSYTKMDTLFEDYGLSTLTPASSLYSITTTLKSELEENNLNKLYYDVEAPLIKVLYDMEKTGFGIDISMLNILGDRYASELSTLTDKIYELSGTTFNINSPKQLSEVLFVKLGLAHSKKNKSGYSSDVEVLAKLKGVHPVINQILRYRQLSKLKSTYIDGLRGQLDNTTNHIHTSFKQSTTVTGRLSSVEPNLQNIPVRDAEGANIRKLFIASKGNMLMCADYSQIELRLLAHCSGDETLIEAYRNGQDIHAITAAAVYGVHQSMVTDAMRRAAKAVNFGIIYGISDYGLSENLKISPKKAKEFIEKYFASYPTVKNYMGSNVEYAHKYGKSVTLLGRIRKLPEINSANFNIRSFGERAAMNMPLQGTAADIIKIAMVKVYNRLNNEGFKAKLILQVHDELIIDTPPEELDRVKDLLVYEMENAIELKVPLTVSVGIGKSWYEAK